MGSSTGKVVWGVVLACCFASCVCLEESIVLQSRRLLGSSGKYKIGDEVPLWASKVGPFANPSETYEYYKLPFCKPKDGVRYKTLGMGEVVDANRMATTSYALNFRVNRKEEHICDVTLTDDDMMKFRKAVRDDWYFQMYYDDLPVWGFIGKVDQVIPKVGQPEHRYQLFTHIHFEIKFNEDRVIEINLQTDPKRAVDISENTKDVKVKFTTSVEWKPTATPYDQRLQRYEKFPLNPIHLEVRPSVGEGRGGEGTVSVK
eukprot:gene9632-9792_t